MSEEEKSLDLKQGDETPSDQGQSEQKTGSEEIRTESSYEEEIQSMQKEISSIDKELEEILNDSDETVYVPKKTILKLKQDRDNYRNGMLSAKQKLAALKQEKEQKEAQVNETLKKIEQEGIKEACKDQTINDNWSEIIQYYTPRRGKNSVNAIVEDLKDAKYLWEKYSANPKKEEKEDKEAKAKLSSSKSKPKPSGESEGQKTKGRTFIPKRTPMDKWYD